MKTSALQSPPRQMTNSIGQRFRLIPSGKFSMGDANYGGFRHESRPRCITLTRPFWLSETLVTQSLWQKVMETAPWRGGVEEFATEGPDHPATFMTWEEATDFCDRLSQLPEEKAAGRIYGLPTEAEWEYACRAGSTKVFPFSDRPELLGDYAWYSDNSDWMPHAVAQKKPNAWGLYDMLGNVCEWVQDVWTMSPSGSDLTDPSGPESGRLSVIRGGGWGSQAECCQPSSRRGNIYYKREDDVGFRVAINYTEPKLNRRSSKKPLAKKSPRTLAAKVN